MYSGITPSTETWAGIPVLRAGPETAPIVFVLHGLGGSKRDQWLDIERLAEAGYHAVAPDAFDHGDRKPADFEARFDPRTRGAEAVSREFRGVVERSARDVAALSRFFLASSPSSTASVLGFSMGGFIGFRAVELAPALSTLVCVAGAPPPGTTTHTLVGRRILTIHGDRDEVVSVDGVRAFQAARSRSEPSEHLELRDGGHVLTEQEWGAVWPRILAWLA